MNHFVASLWQGAIIAAVTTLAVRAVPAAAASKRHFIWWVALVLSLVFPLVDAPDWSGGSQLVLSPVETIDTTGLTLPMPPSWLVAAAVALWAGLTLVYLGRLALGFRRLRQLVSSSAPFDPERVARLTRWHEAIRSGRRAELRVSTGVAGACAVGFRRPTIVVSAPLALGLSDEALESIILHEYAHLQRYDDWARALQCVVLGIARWHPAILWISRQIDVEREIACDQRVVAIAREPLAYARNLTEAASLIANVRSGAPMMAPGSSTGVSLLRLRVKRLIGLAPIRHRSIAVCASAFVVGIVAAVAVWASQLPQLVMFTSRTEQPSMLASASLVTGILHKLPSAFASRVEVEGSRDSFVPPVPRPRPALPEAEPPVTVANIGMSHPASVQDAVASAAPVVDAAPPHLGSTSIPFLARVPHLESAPGPAPDGVDWAAVGRRSAAAGSAVGRAGTATGLAASRAGTSVSRFFKNGGLAIARSFD